MPKTKSNTSLDEALSRLEPEETQVEETEVEETEAEGALDEALEGEKTTEPDKAPGVEGATEPEKAPEPVKVVVAETPKVVPKKLPERTISEQKHGRKMLERYK